MEIHIYEENKSYCLFITYINKWKNKNMVF